MIHQYFLHGASNQKPSIMGSIFAHIIQVYLRQMIIINVNAIDNGGGYPYKQVS
jgi:hypothetical protein